MAVPRLRGQHLKEVAHLDAWLRDGSAASLERLGLPGPKALWSGKVQPGSPEHELKKEIARILARGETVAGITRREIGLPD